MLKTQEEKRAWIKKQWLFLNRKLMTEALKKYWGVYERNINEGEQNAEIMKELLSKPAVLKSVSIK